MLKLVVSDPMDSPSRFVNEEDWEETMPKRMPYTPVREISFEHWVFKGRPTELTGSLT